MNTNNIRATFPSDFLSVTPLGRHAMDCAEEHIRQGWTAPGRKYNLGNFMGDAEVYEEKTGEKLTKDQRYSLEYQIRECLDAAYDPALDDN